MWTTVSDLLHDEPQAVEIVSGETVFHGTVWDVRSETFRYGGSTITRHFVAHPGAVAVVALDDEQRVVLVQQYRHPIRERDWELPAGLRDVEGEDPSLTARRELAEETDLEADDWRHLLTIATTPGGNDERIAIYLATGLRRRDIPFDREHEEADMRVERVPLAEVVQAVLDGRMRNGILAVGVLAAERVLRS